MALTEADLQELQQIYARYCQAVDSNDAEAWAGLFTADGIFDGSVKLRGREEIRQFALARPARLAGEGWQRMQHWTANVVIAQSSDGAAGRCYFMILGQREGEDRPSVIRFGTYADDLVRVDGEWLIQRRVTD